MPKRAFTIIELLVSITIIGLLLGAVALNVNSSQANKRDAQRIGDITMIAKALDASTLTTRGIYPGGTETIADTEATFCASDIDPSKLDLTSFPGNRIPKDPRPTGGLCDGGYVYYLNKKEVSNLASELQVSYVLEVGLEKDKISDEKNLKTAEEVGLNPVDYQGRYFLTGSYCGGICPSIRRFTPGDLSVVDNPGGGTTSPIAITLTAGLHDPSDTSGIGSHTFVIDASVTGGDTGSGYIYTTSPCGSSGTPQATAGSSTITINCAIYNDTENPNRVITITASQAGISSNTVSIPVTVSKPASTLYAMITANPSNYSGTLPTVSMLTATASGTVSGPYTYTVYCDNQGSTNSTTTYAKTFQSGCTFKSVGTFPVSVRISAGGKVATAQVNVVISQPVSPLSASLTASPTSGTAPFTSVLTATVSGDSSTINYTFYCDRSDSGTYITTPYNGKFDGQSVTSKGINCAYTNTGTTTLTKTAKVIIERGGQAIEKRVSVSVQPQPASTLYAMITANPSNYSGTVSTSQPFVPTLTTFVSGTSPGPYTYNLTCGNGTTGLTVTTSVTSVSSTGCKYTSQGSYLASVTVTANGKTATGQVVLTVSAPAPTPVPTPVPTATPQPQNNFTKPSSVAVAPNGAYAYVVNYSNDYTQHGSVSVINTASNTVIQNIPVHSYPTGIAITPNGAYAYVPNFYNLGSVDIISTSTNTVVDTVTVGNNPKGIAITPNGAYAYVTGYQIGNNAGFVSVINTTTRKVTNTINVGNQPRGIAITPNGAYAYVSDYNSISVINIATSGVATIDVSSPYGVAFSPNSAYAYVAQQGSGSISVITTSTNALAKKIAGQSWPTGVAVTPNGSKAYITNYNGGSVGALAIIDTANNTVSNPASGTYYSPYGIAITPNGQYAYITDYINSVSVVNLSTNTITKTIQ